MGFSPAPGRTAEVFVRLERDSSLRLVKMEQDGLFSILVNSDPSRGEIPHSPPFGKGENGLMGGQLKALLA